MRLTITHSIINIAQLILFSSLFWNYSCSYKIYSISAKHLDQLDKHNIGNNSDCNIRMGEYYAFYCKDGYTAIFNQENIT